MSTKLANLIPSVLFVLALLFAGFLVTSASHAGGAVILMPVEDRDVPEGSQISEQRIEEMEDKIGKYKKEMKRSATEQQQERMPQNETLEPEATNPDKS